MRNAFAQFNANLTAARHLGELSKMVDSLTKGALDVSDMLRAELVFSVSALDHFIHEICRIGMIEIAKNSRAKTDGYLKYQLPIRATELAIAGVPPEVWVSDAVRERHSWQSFQDPDKVADAIRLISSKKLWDEVAGILGMTAGDVKITLKLIVDRRNKIAHEADMDPSNPGGKWPISTAMVDNAVGFIERVGASIYKVVM